MERDRIEEQLADRYSRVPAPKGREALEQRLLEAFDQRTSRARPARWHVRRWVAVASLGFGALALSAPTQLRLEVGKEIDLTFPPGGDGEGVPDSVAALARSAGAQVLDVWASARRTPSGTTLVLRVWGDRLPSDADLHALLRQRWPDAAAQVHGVDAALRTTVARRLGAGLHALPATAEERQRAREELIAQLRREHPNAEIDVHDSGDGRREVRVRVHKPGP